MVCKIADCGKLTNSDVYIYKMDFFYSYISNPFPTSALWSEMRNKNDNLIPSLTVAIVANMLSFSNTFSRKSPIHTSQFLL